MNMVVMMMILKIWKLQKYQTTTIQVPPSYLKNQQR